MLTKDEKWRLVAITEAIALVDVSAILPQHKHKRYKARSSKRVDMIVCHHTGAKGNDDAMAAVKRTAAFHSSPIVHDDPKRSGRDWPGIAYHYFVPRIPYVHDGRMVVWQCWPEPDQIITNHCASKPGTTPLINVRSKGVVIQGNTNATDLGENQKRALVGLLDLLLLPPIELSWHSESGKKPACPGKHAERLLRATARIR